MKLSDYRSKYSKKTKQMNVYTSVDFPFVSEDSAKQWLLSIIESNSIFNNQVVDTTSYEKLICISHLHSKNEEIQQLLGVIFSTVFNNYVERKKYINKTCIHHS